MTNITFEMLSERLSYSPETGKFRWRSGDTEPLQWKNKYAGKQAFTSIDSQSGYVQGRCFGEKIYGHRAAWLLFYGEWPRGQVDHINGIRHDNRIENLRMATGSQNSMNSALRGGSSRFRGVCWHKGASKWVASIQSHGKPKHIGLFNCETAAAIARDAEATKLHGDFARLNCNTRFE